jgi:hypothetical protein
MSRSQNIISEEELTSIKIAVEEAFGRKVLQHTDCVHLSAEIYSKTRSWLSEQTLRRTFGLVKSRFSVSLTTLNILAQYAEFADWADFNANRSTKLKPLSAGEISLIKGFYNANIEPPKDINFYQASFVIAQRIFRSNYPESLLLDLAANKTAQVFFYEMFPGFDYLAGKYANGMRAYVKNKKTKEAYVFGHCVLFLRALLLEKSEELKTEFLSLKKIKLNYDIHPLPLTRFYASHWIFYHLTGDTKKSEEWFKKCTLDLADYYSPPENSSTYFPGYHFVMIEYLLLMGKFNEALRIFRLHETISYLIHPLLVRVASHTEVIKIQKSVINSFVGNSMLAKQILKSVDLSNITHFAKKYYTIWYMIAKLKETKSAKRKERILLQIEGLIFETKFSYFRTFMQNWA